MDDKTVQRRRWVRLAREDSWGYCGNFSFSASARFLAAATTVSDEGDHRVEAVLVFVEQSC